MHSPLRMRSIFHQFLKVKVVSKYTYKADLSFPQQLVFLVDDIHCMHICYGKLYVSAVQLCMQYIPLCLVFSFTLKQRLLLKICSTFTQITKIILILLAFEVRVFA